MTDELKRDNRPDSLLIITDAMVKDCTLSYSIADEALARAIDDSISPKGVSPADAMEGKWLDFIYEPNVIVQVPSSSEATPHARIQVVVRGKLGNRDEAIKKTILHLQMMLEHQ